MILYQQIFFDYQATLSGDWGTRLFYLRLHRAVMPINPIFMLLFLYATFHSRIPKQFWLISAAPGDAVLLLSDGLPELFNKDKIIFDLARVASVVIKISFGISHENRAAKE